MNDCSIIKMSIFQISILIGLVFSTLLSTTSATAQHASRTDHVGIFQFFNITDVLLHHDPHEAIMWHEVVTVLERLKQVPACGIEAASRLFTACSELKTDQDDSNAKNDAMKSLFAIRMAVCETAEGGAKVPSACGPAMNALGSDASRENIMQTDLRLIESGALPACIRSLQKEHFYWTSYSNHRQDAGKVCDAMHTGVEQQKIIMFYREVTDSLAGIVNIVDRHRMASEKWFETALSQVRDLNHTYNDVTNSMIEQRKINNNQSLEEFEAIRSVAFEANQAVKNVGNGFADMVAKVRSSMLNVEAAVPTLFSNVAGLFADASHDVVEVVNFQKHELQTMAMAVRELRDLLAADEILQSVQAVKGDIAYAHGSLVSLLQLQAEQMSLLEANNAALASQLDLQKESHESIDEMHAKFQIISLGIDQIAGPVRMVAAVVNAYEESKWKVGLFEVAVFGLFSTGSTILILIRGLRLWGVCLYLCYWFLLSLRACINHAHFSAKWATVKYGLHVLQNHFNTLALAAVVLMLFAAVCIGVCLIAQPVSYAARRHNLKKKSSAAAQKLACHDTYSSEALRATRASTAPPMF